MTICCPVAFCNSLPIHHELDCHWEPKVIELSHKIIAHCQIKWTNNVSMAVFKVLEIANKQLVSLLAQEYCREKYSLFFLHPRPSDTDLISVRLWPDNHLQHVQLPLVSSFQGKGGILWHEHNSKLTFPENKAIRKRHLSNCAYF